MDPLDAMLARRASLRSPTSALNSRLLHSGILRPGDHVVQSVRLESAYPERRRFLTIVSSRHRGENKRKRDAKKNDKSAEEDEDPEQTPQYCLLGVDMYPDDYGDHAADSVEEAVSASELKTSIGLVARLLWDVRISLDGDGGFSVHQRGEHFIFKPATVQALWTVIQTLHMITERLAPLPDMTSSTTSVTEDFVATSSWEESYEVTSPQSCINEWRAMADLLVRRPPSPERRNSWQQQSGEESREMQIKSRLRTIMKAADLDSITSRGIRTQLEEIMGESLEGFKSLIDQEILVILGQMDPASQIRDDYLYLGSEWNASNLEELRSNGITHVLNVTREIDNFFPAVFTYKNVREYDEESTDLLKYLDRTYKFIKRAKESGGRVLIHCKMGISRSATVTIAFIMKEYGLSLKEALDAVKERRSIVKPNKSFLKQLEVYEGILGAIRHKHTYLGLFRSKSESCLLPKTTDEDEEGTEEKNEDVVSSSPKTVTSPVNIRVDIKALTSIFSRPNSEPVYRPKSWSPSEQMSQFFFPGSPRNCSHSKRTAEQGDSDGSCDCYVQLERAESDIENDDNTEEEEGEIQEEEEEDIMFLSPDSRLRRGPPRGRRAAVEARNFALLSDSPVNSSVGVHPATCRRCDLELELSVPDQPAVVASVEEASSFIVDDAETDAIIGGLSNVPLRLRSSYGHEDRQHRQKHQEKLFLPEGVLKQVITPPINIIETTNNSVADKKDDNILTTAPPPPPLPPATEELSVKTLASMFDYKIGSVPYRPCSATLEDCHLFQRAKRLTSDLEEESNC